VKALKDSGLQFDFIAYSAVESGELISKGYRTLVLPMSVALSDREVDAIREFVRGRNADRGRPARHLGRALHVPGGPPLLDVFGIDAPPGSREAISEASGELGLKVTTARALAAEGNRPILISNRFGQGGPTSSTGSCPTIRRSGRRERPDRF